MALTGLAAFVVVVTGAWALDRGDGISLGVASLAWVYAAVLVWRCRQATTWQLAWDGSGWQLTGDGRYAAAWRGEVAVMIDLGDALLLRFVSTDGTSAVWLPLQRGDLPAGWHPLRCALYSPRPASAGATG